MISGGGAGRSQRPRANARNAVAVSTISVLLNPECRSRCAQASQKFPLSRARQLCSARRSPHSTQKLGLGIAGDSAPGIRRLYSIAAAKNALINEEFGTVLRDIWLG
jgi:hypothetical protein